MGCPGLFCAPGPGSPHPHKQFVPEALGSASPRVEQQHTQGHAAPASCPCHPPGQMAFPGHLQPHTSSVPVVFPTQGLQDSA